MTLYAYDRVGQLTNEVCLTNGVAGGETNSWAYDEAGNWLNPREAGTKWVYNADNELIARANTSDTTWAATVTGAVDAGPNSNKWYNTWAEYRGVWGRVGTNTGTFSLPNVPLYAGTNELLVTVRDVSGNASQQTRNVFKTVTNCQEYFRYDGNGNLTNWVNGTTNWVYEWDWLDQLTKATSNGIVVLQNWYDAGGARVAKREVVDGQTNYTLYVWDDWASAATLNSSAQILETFTRGPGVGGDIGTLVAVTHHAGSVTNGIYYTHHNLRGDVNVIRSSATTIAVSDYTPFGVLRAQTGPNVCRFGFTSKEHDVSTGFSYYGYRFYASAWQRWLSPDGRQPVAAITQLHGRIDEGCAVQLGGPRASDTRGNCSTDSSEAAPRA